MPDKITLKDHIDKIRIFLRDPDKKVFTDDNLIINVFNDMQQKVNSLTNMLEDVIALRYPGSYQMSYMYDWEWEFLPKGQSRFYKCLRQNPMDGTVYCHSWEIQEDYGLNGDAGDEGAHVTHPWEAFMGMVVGEQVTMRFPENFNRSLFLAWDKYPLEQITEREIMEKDPSYITYQGEPYQYYPLDDLDKNFVIYPRPGTVVWNDQDYFDESAAYVYTYDWEKDDGYIKGNGQKFTKTDTVNEREYLFTWEKDLGTGEDPWFRGMWLFETDPLILQ